MNKLIFTIIFLISQLTFAECKKPVTYLNNGDTTPCSGYLFSPEKELEVRTKEINYIKMVELTNQQNQLVSVLTDRVDLGIKQNDNLRKQVSNLESQGTFEKIVYFSLGLIIGVSVSGVVK